MLFALICIDKPNSGALRAQVRPQHLAYIETQGSKVVMAGPFLSEDGKAMTGSLIVYEASTIEDARHFSASDPYSKAGLFADVDIRPWRWTVGVPKVS